MVGFMPCAARANQSVFARNARRLQIGKISRIFIGKFPALEPRSRADHIPAGLFGSFRGPEHKNSHSRLNVCCGCSPLSGDSGYLDVSPIICRYFPMTSFLAVGICSSGAART
jgi:hypothetical protein